jgi:hypothetical protein
MALPHFTQLSMTGAPGGPGTQPQEAVYLNLFEITFILPLILQAQGREPILMLQQANSISVDTTPDIDVVTQQYKYSTRAFLTMPSQTHIEFDIKFNVNVNEGGAMETWTTLRAWYDLVWNSQDGTLHYKSDIIGTIIVNQHDKKGVVLRRLTYINTQIKGIDGIPLDWSSNDILKDIGARFVADAWDDEFIDSNFTIEPPIVGGYL